MTPCATAVSIRYCDSHPLQLTPLLHPACSCPCRVTCDCNALTLSSALQLWFLSTSGAVCFVLPFLNLYYANVLGFSSAQIGLLGALKPWMAIPFGEHVL